MVLIWLLAKLMYITGAVSPDKSFGPIEVIEFDSSCNQINCVYCDNPAGILVNLFPSKYIVSIGDHVKTLLMIVAIWLSLRFLPSQ